MKVLVTGGGGQVGRALARTASADLSVDVLTHAQLDITRPAQVAAYFAEARPDCVINAAADTGVDRAETDRERAHALNAHAVAALAQNCLASNARLIHISTDYVFDGQSLSAYEPSATTHPINAYGASKLAGEQAIAAVRGLRWAIVRTSWVYSPWGKNFLLTMLRLMVERSSVSVVNDQIGAPTSALNLARFLWQVVAKDSARGVLHFTDAGVASWYDFAVAIAEEARAVGLIKKPVDVQPIGTSEYPTPAKRPAFSLLATKSSLLVTEFQQTHWRAALREILQEIRPS